MPHHNLFLFVILFFGIIGSIIAQLPEALPDKAPQQAKIVLEQTHGPYLGFGIGIHPGDVIYETAFEELDLEFVRLEFGPLWYDLDELIPADASLDELYSFIAANYNGDAYNRLEGAQYTYRFLNDRDIKIVLIHFELPYHWRRDKATGLIEPQYIDDLARFYTAHLRFLRDNGVHIDYIELANEPDGNWNGHLPPESYVSLLKQCDHLFEANDLGHVQILGPGLAFLNLYNRLPPYMDALALGAHVHLDGWSTHTWDEVEFPEARPEYTFGVWQPFLNGIKESDPLRRKPILVTEYGSDVTRFGDRIYTSPRDQFTENLTDSWDYAIRVVANSITHLNRGANALILYRLSNAHWQKTGWGIIQPETPERYRKKPIYQAIYKLLSDLPLGAQILQPNWYTHDDPILLAVFHDEASQQLSLIAINWTDTDQSQTIQLPGAYRAVENRQLDAEGFITDEANISLDDDQLTLNLPANSMCRIELETNQTKPSDSPDS
ncbi:MAG: hypothetical protein AAF065_04370 [Verrucomicrobiota bacterium]